jgi:glycine cleavage system aminomethyltransferase T
MKNAIVYTALLLCAAAHAADPKAVPMTLVDHSNALLISGADAKAVMAENLPASVFKIHPASRFAFVSQVEGGMKGSTCIVSARVMLVPLTAAAKAVLFRPQKMATAFDAAPNSSTEACKAMAREKLKEATSAVASGIVKI